MMEPQMTLCFLLCTAVVFVQGAYVNRPNSTGEKKCPAGLPAVDRNGKEISCARGSKQSCPTAAHCVVEAGDRWAVCCPSTLPLPQNTTTDPKCPFTPPVKDENGVEYFCGRGPTSRPCPGATQCRIAPNDAYAVCCEIQVDNPDQPTCPVGAPVRDSSGVQYFCGRGLSRRDCPSSTECNIAPNDAFAVCCEKRCPSGQPAKDVNGTEYFCGRGPSSRPCPGATQCRIAPNDAYAVCCEIQVDNLDEPTCPVGAPVRDSSGVQYFCGRGTSRRDCPLNSECNIAPNDAFAVCCEKRCPSGQPAKDLNGTEYFCGRGPSRRACPERTECVVDPADRFAVCCEERKCPVGEPLTDHNGVEYFCGLGPSSRGCPNGSNCNISPVDAFAVCCQQSSVPMMS